MKIYTRGGDQGTTQLLSAGRVSKAHPRVAAYGDVDELNSAVGVARAQGLTAPLGDWLETIQVKLFDLGSLVAVPNPSEVKLDLPQIGDADVAQLEQWVDTLDEELPRLSNFILPGGGPGAAQLQLARTVCRRAERALVALAAEEIVPGTTLRYLNRLSDLLFTMARYENLKRGVAETLWRAR